MATSTRQSVSLVVLMGVSGSGKSTVGPMVAGALGVAFIDGDDHHDPANIERMHRSRSIQPGLVLQVSRMRCTCSTRDRHRCALRDAVYPPASGYPALIATTSRYSLGTRSEAVVEVLCSLASASRSCANAA